MHSQHLGTTILRLCYYHFEKVVRICEGVYIKLIIVLHLHHEYTSMKMSESVVDGGMVKLDVSHERLSCFQKISTHFLVLVSDGSLTT